MFEEENKKKKIIIRIMLAMPLILSICWLVYIKATEDSGPYGFLSPPIDNKPLIIGLVLFTSGYLLFLGMMFGHDVLEWFAEFKNRHSHR